jgi:hypothetical protein
MIPGLPPDPGQKLWGTLNASSRLICRKLARTAPKPTIKHSSNPARQNEMTIFVSTNNSTRNDKQCLGAEMAYGLFRRS